MFYFSTNHTEKPNRFEKTEKEKNSDKEYHLNYARFAFTDASNSLHQEFLAKTKLNKNFYKGNQWVFDEDLEAFLKDDTDQTRNRIQIIHNLIRPMIEQSSDFTFNDCLQMLADCIYVPIVVEVTTWLNRCPRSLGKLLQRSPHLLRSHFRQ